MHRIPTRWSSPAQGLARSQQLLEATDRPVEQVAVLAGFGSAASLRQHFQRAFGVTPSVWRQGFRGDYLTTAIRARR
jgi:transcriptional regulator GlxA family with amidase domain